MANRILIVDDEEDLLKVTLLRLKKTGYEVFGGANGQQALDFVRQIVPDLVILDVYLPVMNGDDVAKILKKDEQLKHIPVILISADVETLAQRARDCDAMGYLSKPYEAADLIEMIKRILG